MTDKVVHATERQWADIVADADHEPEDTTVYEFSNGRKFESPATT